MRPDPKRAVRRVPVHTLVVVVVLVGLFAGCTSSVPSPVPSPVAIPPAARLEAAAAVTGTRPVGTAGVTLTLSVAGSTAVEETRSGWSEDAWSSRVWVVADGVSTPAGEVVAVDGLLHVSIEGGPWQTLPAVPGSDPESLRDPGDVLALLRKADDVQEGPHPDVLVATVPPGARFEVGLTGGAVGSEAVAAVRGTVPPAAAGVTVLVDAWWSAEAPAPIVAPGR